MALFEGRIWALRWWCWEPNGNGGIVERVDSRPAGR